MKKPVKVCILKGKSKNAAWIQGTCEKCGDEVKMPLNSIAVADAVIKSFNMKQTEKQPHDNGTIYIYS